MIANELSHRDSKNPKGLPKKIRKDTVAVQYSTVIIAYPGGRICRRNPSEPN
jgi:hypothetical protein